MLLEQHQEPKMEWIEENRQGQPNLKKLVEADQNHEIEQLISAEMIKDLLNDPDLVFLDTNFCNGTGFELLNKFQTVDFQVIFTASCEEYAMQAFKVHAADYLLKPVHPQLVKNRIKSIL